MKIIDKLVMIHIAVTDMVKAKHFYESILGCRVTKDYGQGGQHWVSLELPGGGVSLNLSTMHENMKPGTMKLYFSTADIEESFSDLKNKKINPINEITNDSWGKWFNVSDPDGNNIMIVQS